MRVIAEHVELENYTCDEASVVLFKHTLENSQALLLLGSELALALRVFRRVIEVVVLGP